MTYSFAAPYYAEFDTHAEGQDYGYAYPHDLNLRPGADQHAAILRAVMQRARLSFDEMQRRHDSWDKIDETDTAYIRTDDAERMRLERDPRKPVSIVMPVTYTIKQTLLTHWSMSYLVDPFLRYQGQGPEDHVRSILMEKVIDSQFQRAGCALNIYTGVSDALKYGFGGVSVLWETVRGKRTAVRDTGFHSQFLGEFFPTGKERYVAEAVKHEGNRLVNIDPRRYLPDPNRPVHEVERGEFAGWVERTNYMQLRKLEKQGEVFNIRYLKGYRDGRSRLIPRNTRRPDRDREMVDESGIASDLRPVDVIWMYAHVLPEDWGMGDSDDIELWIFGVAADGLLIKANKLDLTHGQIPIAIWSPNFDGHSIAPISDLEVTYGAQKLVDWMLNSHVASMTQLIRNLIVYDPSQINPQDMMTPGRSLVRARRRAFGSSLRDAIFQVPMNDVTQRNMGDINVIIDLMKRVTGATDPLQGIDTNAPERRSAEEASGLRQSAFARVAKMNRIMTLQAMRKLGVLFAEHTQQFMSQDAWAQTLGTWPQVLAAQYGPNQPIPVSPEDIVCGYDVVTTDTGISGGESLDSAVRVFETVANNPYLLQKFDIARIFADVARLGGFKNLHDYAINGGGIVPSVMGMEQIQSQVQAGDLAPMSEAA